MPFRVTSLVMSPSATAISGWVIWPLGWAGLDSSALSGKKAIFTSAAVTAANNKSRMIGKIHLRATPTGPP